MELGISTASFYTKLATEDTFSQIASIGANVCEVFLSSFSEYNGAILDEIVKNMCINTHSIHALTNQFEPDLFNRNERASNDAFNILENVLAAGERLGAKFYTFHGPTILKKINYNFDYSRLAQVVHRIMSACKRHNIQLSYETVHWTYFNQVEYFEQLKKLCPELKCTIDIKQIMQAGGDLSDFINRLGSDISTVHLCDYDKNRKLLLPGRGVFDFEDLGNKLRNIGFDGVCILEVYPECYNDYSELADAYRYVAQQMKIQIN